MSRFIVRSVQTTSLMDHSDLILYLPFEGDLDDESGSTSSHDGATIGTTTYDDDTLYNQCIDLDGIDDAVSFTDNAELKPTGDFTIGMTIKNRFILYVFTFYTFFHKCIKSIINFFK